MGLVTILPPVVAILFVLWRKEVVLALIMAIFTSEVILLVNSGASPVFSGFSQTVERIIHVFQSSGNTRILVFSLVIGALLALIKSSGGVTAMVRWLIHTGMAKSRRHVSFLTTMTGIVVFIESNLSVLTAGILSRGLFDRYGMSRARLAYIIDSTSAPICILILLNAWGAFVLALLENEELGQPAISVLVGTIPLNFYALVTLAIVFYTVFTDRIHGPMKKTEENIQIIETTEDDVESSHLAYMAVPMSIMIFGMVTIMYFTGVNSLPAGEEHSFFDKLTAGNGSQSVLYSTILATLVAYIMLLIKRKFNHIQLVKISFEGMGELLPLVSIVLLSLALGDSLRELGTGLYVAKLVGGALPVVLVIPMLFISGALISFSTGTSWGTFAILIPLGVPLIQMLNLPPSLAISAILGGGIFGDHCSPISDTTAVSSIASGCDLLEHVKTQLPYALFAGGITVLLYILASYLMM